MPEPATLTLTAEQPSARHAVAAAHAVPARKSRSLLLALAVAGLAAATTVMAAGTMIFGGLAYPQVHATKAGERTGPSLK